MNHESSDRPTFQFGLIGYPLSHSFSPKLHTAALRSCGLEGEYSLFPIAPDDKQGLEDLLAHVRAGKVQGLNVTIPHKQNVIPFLDELTPTAKAIGAVNTIYLRNARLIGDNTDAPGFLIDLQTFLASETRGFRESKALVLGAGGSARAVVHALIQAGWEIAIAARRPEQVEELAAAFHSHEIQSVNDRLSNFDVSSLALIVNTTPLGMTPNVDGSAWPTNLPLPRHAVVYDLVYNPPETQLVREARRQGLKATTGLGMLIEQAALAFELWTGHSPAREILRAALQPFPILNP